MRQCDFDGSLQFICTFFKEIVGLEKQIVMNRFPVTVYPNAVVQIVENLEVNGAWEERLKESFIIAI